MPIKIPDHLPAASTLKEEGVDIIHEHDAIRQDIRPMRIAMLNLMPEKIKTETQIARLIGATPLQIDFTLLTTGTYTATHTSREHMSTFYRPWHQVQAEKFDGLIVTGAPVEEMDFEDVKYWPELCSIFDWARTNVFSLFTICWGAQAALYHRYGVPKHLLPRKLSGIYEHRIVRRGNELLRGFIDTFPVPVSRYTETRARDIVNVPQLDILVESDESGICLVQDRSLNSVHIFNHLEYDTFTLSDEYQRDTKARPATVRIPENYFPDNDPAKLPRNTWRAYAHLLLMNWINEIYQHTPFDLEQIGKPRGAQTGGLRRAAGRAKAGAGSTRRRKARAGRG